eukprot:2246350-Prymnesium_polylepis.2
MEELAAGDVRARARPRVALAARLRRAITAHLHLGDGRALVAFSEPFGHKRSPPRLQWAEDGGGCATRARRVRPRGQCCTGHIQALTVVLNVNAEQADTLRAAAQASNAAPLHVAERHDSRYVRAVDPIPPAHHVDAVPQQRLPVETLRARAFEHPGDVETRDVADPREVEPHRRTIAVAEVIVVRTRRRIHMRDVHRVRQQLAQLYGRLPEQVGPEPQDGVEGDASAPLVCTDHALALVEVAERLQEGPAAVAPTQPHVAVEPRERQVFCRRVVARLLRLDGFERKNHADY